MFYLYGQNSSTGLKHVNILLDIELEDFRFLGTVHRYADTIHTEQNTRPSQWCERSLSVCLIHVYEQFTPGNHVIHLGIPQGVDINELEFWKTIYLKGKHAIINMKNFTRTATMGRHQLINACFYGRLRYYLWSLLLPKEIEQAIISDTKVMLWRKDPTLDGVPQGLPR